MSNFNPFNLSKEELDDLNKLIQSITIDDDSYRHITSYGDYGSWDNPVYDRDYRVPKKHKWKGTLLVRSTVYNCEHCGVAQEKTTSEYCDEEF